MYNPDQDTRFAQLVMAHQVRRNYALGYSVGPLEEQLHRYILKSTVEDKMVKATVDLYKIGAYFKMKAIKEKITELKERFRDVELGEPELDAAATLVAEILDLQDELEQYLEIEGLDA